MRTATAGLMCTAAQGPCAAVLCHAHAQWARVPVQDEDEVDGAPALELLARHVRFAAAWLERIAVEAAGGAARLELQPLAALTLEQAPAPEPKSARGLAGASAEEGVRAMPVSRCSCGAVEGSARCAGASQAAAAGGACAGAGARTRTLRVSWPLPAQMTGCAPDR